MVNPSLMQIRIGELQIDDQRFRLERNGERLRIRPKVFDLLVHLIRNHERVVLREELVMALWGTTAVGHGSLSGLVNELRQILGESGKAASSIRTVHARGYQFVGEVESLEPDTSERSLPIHARGNSDPEMDAVIGALRASFARASTTGATAVVVEGAGGPRRSRVIDRATHDLLQAGFEVHHLPPSPQRASSRESTSTDLADRLFSGLIEYYGIETLRAALPARERSFLERASNFGGQSPAGPREPLAARQHADQVFRSAAVLLRVLARQRPIALVIDDLDHTRTATLARSLLRPLGPARVFILATAAPASGDDSEAAVAEADPSVEYLRLEPFFRRRLNALLESRGVRALPKHLADALVAHVGDDEVSLDPIVESLQEAFEATWSESGGQPTSEPEHRMRRVPPKTDSRRAGSSRS